MAVQCEFLKRQFKITSKEIKNLQSVDLTTEIDYTEQTTVGGLPQLAITGYKPQSFTVSYNCVTSAGVNPYKEYCAWKKLIGKTGEFYLGQDQFGVDVFTLMNVSMNGGKVNARGEFVSGQITLELSQDIVTGGE
jgi:hypothetical protein